MSTNKAYSDSLETDDALPSVAVTDNIEPMNVEQPISFEKGVLQEPAYRDKWWGVLFLAHLGTIVCVSFLYANGTLETDFEYDGENDGTRRLLSFIGKPNKRFLQNYEFDDNANIDDDESGVKFLTTFFFALIIAPALSIFMMTYMKQKAVELIQTSLYFSIGFNILMGILLVISGGVFAGIFPFLFAAILFCYAKAVWHRIPFAAANLKAAITVVQSNLGMALMGLLNIPLFTIWFLCWGYVTSCVANSPWMKAQETQVEVTDDMLGEHEENQVSTAGTMAFIALTLSFYWTLQVIKNVVHTSLAGTVGTWWFVPHEANRFCSKGLTDSLCRSLTYSFGSICLGSLIVAIIETLRSMLRSQARNRRGGLLRLIAECLLRWIERIAEYFNRWAFVYVGLYGYSYMEAGKNVFNLFRHKGWTTIISDSLVHRMLLMMCFCVGLINAALAAILAWMEAADGAVIGFSALWGLFIGFLLSTFVFGVILSAVDSIIVLYAEAPTEFQTNHPELAAEMKDTWAQAWPDVFSPGGQAVATAEAVEPTGNLV